MYIYTLYITYVYIYQSTADRSLCSLCSHEYACYLPTGAHNYTYALHVTITKNRCWTFAGEKLLSAGCGPLNGTVPSFDICGRLSACSPIWKVRLNTVITFVVVPSRFHSVTFVR